MLWWDSFDEGAEFGPAEASLRGGAELPGAEERGAEEELEELEVAFRRAEELLRENDG